MNDRDQSPSLDRRRFLRQSAGAAALAGTIGMLSDTGVAFAALTDGDIAAAAKHATAGPAAAKTLTVMARDLYPHDQLDASYYRNAIVVIDGKLSQDKATKALLHDGVASLDATAKKLKGKPYAALTAEDDRVAVLKSIEETPFFQKVRGEMVVALYNQPGVWKTLGYEGPSADKGGYIQRGFNDIDWLQS
jgi:hypothetical protein